jgi:hypothetical protein
MTVPPHYSAAPSGDLCTTLSSCVVRGESRRNVPITGDRPLPELGTFRREAEAAGFAACDTVLAALGGNSEGSNSEGSNSRGSTFEDGTCDGPVFRRPNARVAACGEQLKHVSNDAGFGNAGFEHRRLTHDRSDRFPRNNFFT